MRSVKYWLAVASTCAFIAMSANAVLADASDQQVNDTRAFIEYAFGFSLDANTVQLIRDGLTSDMAKNESGSLATLNDMNTFMSYVHSHPAASGALLRTCIEPELVAAFQADTSDPTSRALVATWRAHNHIVADGRPPLRKDVVESYIAMFEFISKQTGKQVPAEIKNHSQFSARVARQYATATRQSVTIQSSADIVVSFANDMGASNASRKGSAAPAVARTGSCKRARPHRHSFESGSVRIFGPNIQRREIQRKAVCGR